jgi:hypothetical protein
MPGSRLAVSDRDHVRGPARAPITLVAAIDAASAV